MKRKKPKSHKFSQTTTKAKTTKRNQAKSKCIVRTNKLQSNKQQIPPQHKVGIQIQLRDYNALIERAQERLDDGEAPPDTGDYLDVTSIIESVSDIGLVMLDVIKDAAVWLLSMLG